MGKSKTSKYQLGKIYSINKSSYQAVKTKGTPGNEYVEFENVYQPSLKIKRKQQYVGD